MTAISPIRASLYHDNEWCSVKSHKRGGIWR